ncbi:MAG: hypothetical protein AAF125_26690, partial [Chloroflexota bacterium]
LATALRDPVIGMTIGDPNNWETVVEYDGFGWNVIFSDGFNEWVAVLVQDEEDMAGALMIDEFYNAAELEEEEEVNFSEDLAIMLAYDADGIEDALVDRDDWQTFVQPLTDTSYTVEFVAGDTRLACIVADIQSETTSNC